MSHRGLSDAKSEYLEIGEYNFSWPGANGTFQDFGSMNYTMPSGMDVFLYKLFFYHVK